MSSPKSTEHEAKVFLTELGLDDYVEELVNKNKFKTKEDLSMLATLENNVYKELGLPICVLIKLRNALKDKKHQSEESSLSDDNIKSSDNDIMTPELQKKRLLELCKTTLAAQVANQQLNTFNSLLNERVKEYKKKDKWQGSGALRVSAGTTLQQAQENFSLASHILDGEEFKPLYGTYIIPGEGKVTITRKKGMSNIGNKLSHLRKPSAYVPVLMKNSGRRKVKNADSRPMIKSSNQEKEAAKKSKEMEEELFNQEPEESSTSQEKEAAKMSEEVEDQVSDQEPEEEEQISEYEKRIKQKREENNKVKLRLGIVPSQLAIIMGLFYLKLKQSKMVQMKFLKRIMKELKLVVNKESKKEDLLIRLGTHVFKTKKVVLVDESKDVCFENLAFTSKECK